MSTYAVGDIQGCFQTFKALLEQLRFKPENDRLWIAGDLVNRGPESLSVLRWLMKHDAVATCVLGNHDLHLLARHLGIQSAKQDDTIENILHAIDRDELIDWLRRRPIMTRGQFGTKEEVFMVHGGVLPQWSADDAWTLAKDIESVLASDEWPALIEMLIAHKQTPWSIALAGIDSLAVALKVMTRIRYVDRMGRFENQITDAPSEAPPGYFPWFAHPERQSRNATYVIGHWSTLGFYRGYNVLALDSGCVHGRTLTALRLEDHVAVSVPSLDKPRAKKKGMSA